MGLGHIQVKYDQLATRFRNNAERLRRVVETDHLVTNGSQLPSNQPSDLRIIIHVQDDLPDIHRNSLCWPAQHLTPCAHDRAATHSMCPATDNRLP